MPIQLQRDPYTNKWTLPGETYRRAGGGRSTSGITKVITFYDVHDATAYRIHRAWKDDIVGYDNSPLRRPTKSFKTLFTWLHPYTYGNKDTRVTCRQLLANWLAGDCGIEVDVMRAIMDQIPFVPETYMRWTIANHDAIMGHIAIDKQCGVLDNLLPPYVPRVQPTMKDALLAALQPQQS